MGLYEIDDRGPTIDPGVYLAPGSQVVGDITIGPGSSVWFNAVLRGDMQPVRIGARTNVQDLALVHATSKRHPCEIGDDVSIGHGARLHGCRIIGRAMIGTGAVLLDGSEVGEDSIVAAQALVRVGFKVPAGTLVAGVPAVVKRELTQAEREEVVRAAQRYAERARGFRERLRAAQRA
jgi:carbonic anhydrase/acetyltransferase-like protein (isoleucine patch superfamily)